MKTLLVGILILIMLFSIYGYGFPPVEPTLQRVTTALRPPAPLKDMPQKGPPVDPPRRPTKDPEIDKMVEEVRREQIVIINPLARKLAEMEGSDLSASRLLGLKKLLNLLLRIRELNALIVRVVLATALATFLWMLCVRNTPLSGVALLLAKASFSVGRIIVFLTALIALVAWFAFGYNLFVDFGIAFVCSLLFFIFFSAASLKMYDFNHPVWKRTIYAVMWPTISGIVIRVS